MHKNNFLANSVRLALVGGVAALAFTSVAAIAAEAQGEKIERIEVTGSSIKRTDMEGSLPITVISREDIDRTGLTSAGDLVQSLPSMQGFTTDADSVGGGGGGVKSASLRGLGASYTLVLMNGRRMAPRGSGSTIDLNSIPLAAIERVEVLTDGASALYGSDAIAGVVNFITKKDLQGFNVAARYNKPQESGGTSSNLSFTGGFGDYEKDGFNILFSVGHDEQEQLKATDRDFAKSGIINFSRNNQEYYYVKGSPNAIPGNARAYYMEDGVRKNVVFNPYLKTNGNCAPDNFQVGDLCQFDYTTTVEILPESSRDSVILGADFALTDDIKLFANMMYSDFSQTTRIAPNATGFFTIPTDSPLVDQWVIPNLTQAQRDNLVRVDAQWRALPLGGRATEWNTKSTHIVTGIEGLAGEIDYSAAFTYSKNDTDENVAGGYPLFDEFMTLMGTGKVDIFATPDQISQEGKDLLAQTQFNGNWSNDTTEVKALDAKASMPIFETSAGTAYLGTGAEFRNTHYVSSIAEANKQDLLLGSNTGTEYDLARDSYGAFVELIVPVITDLELTGSLRYDNVGAITNDFAYDDAGVAIPGSSTVNDSESAVTYKISVRYQATEDLLLRASTGTGFKVPSMLSIANPRVDFGVTSGSYDCPFAGTSDPLATLCPTSAQQYEAFSEGNAKLKPETSKQYSIGFVYAPDSDFSFSLDYWNIELSDMVTSVTESQIMADPARYRDLFTTKLNKGTGEEEIAIVYSDVNVGKSKNAGYDWNLTLGHDLSFGRLNNTLSGTYITNSEYTRPGTENDWISSLGRFGDDDAVVFRTTAQLVSTLKTGDFDNSVTIRYRSGYADQENYVREGSISGDDKLIQLAVPSYTTVNFQTQYTVIDDLKLSFGINNLFDVAPPLSLRASGAGHQVGYDPRYTDSLGRTFYASVDYKF